jgi:hypothetical protein
LLVPFAAAPAQRKETVNPTLFGVLWVPIVLLFAWKPVRLLQLAILGSIFQGAAIAQQGAGLNGLAILPSLLPAVLFLGHGVMRTSADPVSPVQRQMLRLLFPLLLLTVYAVLSSYLLPRLFEGTIRVWPPRPHTTADFSLESLAPDRGNLTQTFYIILHVGVTLTAALLLRSSLRTQVLLVRTYIFSGLVVLAICVWELTSHVAGVPYPKTFLHSNQTISDLVGATMGGVERISGPFMEASFLAMFLSGSLFASLLLVLNGVRSWTIYILGFGSFFMMLLSTSTTGLMITALLLLLILALPLAHTDLPGLRRIGGVVAIIGVLALVAAAILPEVAPQAVHSIQHVVRATLQKKQSQSYDIRSHQDLDSIMVPLETYGLGAGWGSVRASSLVTTIAGDVGIPGLLLCAWFGISLARRVIETNRLPLNRESRYVIHAASGMLFGNLLAAALAVADVDSLAIYILLAALVACITGAVYESEKTLRPDTARPSTLSADPRLQPQRGKQPATNDVAHVFHGRH